jgi:hypothetical protein
VVQEEGTGNYVIAARQLFLHCIEAKVRSRIDMSSLGTALCFRDGTVIDIASIELDGQPSPGGTARQSHRNVATPARHIQDA